MTKQIYDHIEKTIGETIERIKNEKLSDIEQMYLKGGLSALESLKFKIKMMILDNKLEYLDKLKKPKK